MIDFTWRGVRFIGDSKAAYASALGGYWMVKVIPSGYVVALRGHSDEYLDSKTGTDPVEALERCRNAVICDLHSMLDGLKKMPPC
jgi:hypothetical protein